MVVSVNGRNLWGPTKPNAYPKAFFFWCLPRTPRVLCTDVYRIIGVIAKYPTYYKFFRLLWYLCACMEWNHGIDFVFQFYCQNLNVLSMSQSEKHEWIIPLLKVCQYCKFSLRSWNTCLKLHNMWSMKSISRWTIYLPSRGKMYMPINFMSTTF